MLTVPAKIQSLLKDDGILKNFRVHFPNGENADLTNADIVSGSVRFTESVSSKDVLQFGLAESPRIEFECVNVPNIYGMTIECGIEVDTSSLSAADITTIQGNPGDGTLVLSADSDIGYGYYRIPYGVFTVTSCPRSAGAMWKRRVEAYGRDIATTEESEFLHRKLGLTYYVPTIKQNLPNLFAQEANVLPFTTTDSTVSMTSASIGTSSLLNLSWNTSGGADNVHYDLSPHTQNRTYYVYNTVYDNIEDLFRFTCEADTSVIDEIYADMRERHFFDYAPNRSEYFFNLLRCMLEPMIVFGTTDLDYLVEGLPFDNVEDSGYLYTYSNAHDILIVYPYYSLDFDLYKDGVIEKTYHVVPYITNPSLKKYNATDTRLQYMNMEFPNTRDYENGTYQFYRTVDIPSLLEGFAELNAKYIQCDRKNGIRLVGLSKSSPISMDTDEYMEMWWDEYDVSPIGTVDITYKDSNLNAEQEIEYSLGTNGLSVYDMTSNYIFKNMTLKANDVGETLYTYVTELVKTYFKPNVTAIGFTPTDLSALGLPYIEAGDYLEIDDGNGGTVGTYIMSRTLSGVQFLEDDIESKGGEIIGNVRSA